MPCMWKQLEVAERAAQSVRRTRSTEEPKLRLDSISSFFSYWRLQWKLAPVKCAKKSVRKLEEIDSKGVERVRGETVESWKKVAIKRKRRGSRIWEKEMECSERSGAAWVCRRTPRRWEMGREWNRGWRRARIADKETAMRLNIYRVEETVAGIHRSICDWNVQDSSSEKSRTSIGCVIKKSLSLARDNS